MATVQQLKATVRPKAGKGASRAARYSGKVPGVIYGENKPPVLVLIEHDELKKRIYGGRFLTTLYELEVEGTKHRVLPRDFQLDAIKDLPMHVDFLRVSEGAIIRVNAAYAKMLGYRPEEMVGLVVRDLTHLEDHDLKRYAQLLRGDVEAYTTEQRYVRRDGTTAWCRFSVSMARTREGGRAFLALAIIEDIDDRHRAQLALEAAKRDLEALVAQRTEGQQGGVVPTIDVGNLPAMDTQQGEAKRLEGDGGASTSPR